MQLNHLDSVRAALATYNSLGSLYDAFTSADRDDRWLAILDEQLGRAGIPGNRLLDIGCGTGKSTLGMWELGYEATGCDISAAMLAHARFKSGDTDIPFIEADMRELPLLGEFDVALATDGVLNHLLTEEDLAATFRSVRRQLVGTGLLLFDVNTLYAYRNCYASTSVPIDNPRQFMVWQGHASRTHVSGTQATATLTAFATRPDGTWRKTTTAWRQLHHPTGRIARLLVESGYHIVDSIGLTERGELRWPLVETEHKKAIWIARAE